VVELGVALADQVLLSGLQRGCATARRARPSSSSTSNGFLQEVLDAELERFTDDLRRAVCGHHHDLRPLASEASRTRRAAARGRSCRHDVVDTNRSKARCVSCLCASAGDPCLDDIVSFVAEGASEPLQNLFLVVEDEHRSRAGRSYGLHQQIGSSRRRR
jgi:hypothetical protein